MNKEKDFVLVLTRDPESNKELANRLKNYQILDLASFEIIPADLSPLQIRLEDYHMLVFTSYNATKIFCDNLTGVIPSLRLGCSFAIVGKRSVDLLMECFPQYQFFLADNAEELTRRLDDYSLDKHRVLHFASNLSLSTIGDYVRGKYGTYEQIEIYQNRQKHLTADQLRSLKSLAAKQLIFIFYSPSAVRYTIESLRKCGLSLADYQCISIGKTTSREIVKHGGKVIFEPEASEADLIVRYLNNL